MDMFKWVLIIVGVVIAVLAVLLVLGLVRSVYLSIPYDKWVEMQKKQKPKREKR